MILFRPALLVTFEIAIFVGTVVTINGRRLSPFTDHFTENGNITDREEGNGDTIGAV